MQLWAILHDSKINREKCFRPRTGVELAKRSPSFKFHLVNMKNPTDNWVSFLFTNEICNDLLIKYEKENSF